MVLLDADKVLVGAAAHGRRYGSRTVVTLRRSRLLFPLLALAVISSACARGDAAPDRDRPAAQAPSRSTNMSTRYRKPADDELRRALTPVQYEVTQRDATEPAFRNAFWDNHEAGLYVDVVTGEPLFSSRDKFD